MFTSHLLTPSHRIPHHFHMIVLFSFVVGDVFMIEDVINQSWLWVTLQRNKERGLVPKSYVEDVVGACIIHILLPGYFIETVVSRYMSCTKKHITKDVMVNCVLMKKNAY